MAYIKHFFIEEVVYENCCDRGIRFYDYVNKQVEHYKYSECRAEVNKDSAFCPKCGVKFSSIKDSYTTLNCYICDTKFKKLSHEDTKCCSTCSSIMYNHRYDKKEMAKAFYELGKNKSNVKRR